MAKKVGVVLTLGVLFVFALGTVAFAASPQDIYADYAQDSKLDADYTTAELEAYLNDAGVHQYGDPMTLTALDDLVYGMLQGGSRPEFPFTGVGLVGLVLGAGLLVAGGLTLSRLSRRCSC